MSEHFDYIIVGTGFSGISMACKLKRRGEDNFVVLDRAEGPGGTWRDNTYPGVACDIPSHVYSFSFHLNPNWSKFFAPGEEIQQYMLDVIREEGIEPHIRQFNELKHAEWNEAESLWHITTAQGEYTCKYYISAVGSLTVPTLPDIPGIDTFTGDKMHTAKWDHSVDLTGKRIAVVGTGASAIQVIPEMVKIGSEVVVFQRTPSWIRPRPDYVYSETTKRAFARDHEALERHRENIYWYLEQGFAARRNVATYKATATQEALNHLHNQVEDPELRAKLTPDYEIGCKRVLLSNNFYPAIQDPKVTLETSALVSMDGNTVTAASGESYEVDAVVFATGFDATTAPFAPYIHNGSGTSLEDHWNVAGMKALDSITVAGFPNLFIINGPNTSLGHNSTVHIVESQADFVLDTLDYLEESGYDVFEATQEEEDRYIAEMDAEAEETIWLSGGCKSWYFDHKFGRLTTIYPNSAQYFRDHNGVFNPEKYTFRKSEREAVTV